MNDERKPLTVSMAIQLGPLRQFESEQAFTGDLASFAEWLTRYFATNIEKFTDPRSADVFIALTVQRGDESAAHEYRSGHYVKPDAAVSS